MQNILIDSGILIALFDGSDSYHKQSVLFLKNNNYKYISSWAVMTEVSYMLSFNVNAQISFLEWVNSGGITIYDLPSNALEQIIKLSKKYKDIPMDLADASLVILSNELSITKIITINSNFTFYKTIKNKFLTNIFQ